MSEPWTEENLGRLTRRRAEVVTLAPGESYRLMGVRWKNLGPYERGLGTTDSVKAKSMFRMRQGDFVFNRIDTDKGAFGVVDAQMSGAVASNEFPAYVCDQSQLLSGYLWLHFQQETVLGGLRGAGSEGRARWKEADFERHTLLLPSVPAQYRIVDLIGALDQAIEGAEENAVAANTLLREVFLSFADRHRIRTSVGSFVGLVYGKALKASDRDGGDVQVFGAAGPIGRHTTATTSAGQGVVVVGRKGVNAPGDFSFPLRNTPDSVRGWGGAGSVRFSSEPIWVIDTAYHAISKIDVDLRAVYWSLVFADLPQVATTTTLPGLNREAAYSRKTIQPLDIGPEMLNLLDSVEEAVIEAVGLAGALRGTRANLLTALLSGEHEIPSSYDEHLGAIA